MWKSSIIPTVLLALPWLLTLGCGNQSENESADPETPAAGTFWENPPPLVPADRLAETEILPHAEGSLTPGKNYVYCGTFQLAWNELQDTLTKEPIRLEGDPPMVESLNKRTFEKSDLADDCYLAMAGSAQDGIVERIRREMRTRFPNATMEVPKPERETTVYAYAYLQKTLAFREPFDRPSGPLWFRSGAPGSTSVGVAAFGVEEFVPDKRGRLFQKQVTVLAYTDSSEFVIRLNTQAKDDEIILAKIPPQPTLAETIQDAQGRIRKSNLKNDEKTLREYEPLIVPIVKLHVERAYSELVGKYFENANASGLYVARARQGIHFRFDERGAKLESYAEGDTGDDTGQETRQFIFDRPFLLYLKEKDSDVPYFAMWIETAEVLERASRR